VLAISESGKAIFFKATTDSYDKVGENDLKEPVFATPAVSDSQLFIRTAKHLIAIGKKGA
jgi:hypothetical protein